MAGQSQLAFRVCTAINLIAATVWILLFLEWSSLHSPISDYGAPLGLIVLFVLVPSGLVGLWRLRRRRPFPLSSWQRSYLWLSAVFLGATWVFSWIPVIFWAGILSAGVSHLWPISLREGPDTAFAKEQFQRHFGFLPRGIDGLYCRRGWEFGDGTTYRMKFHFQNHAIIESIVSASNLKPVPESAVPNSWLVEASSPSWWPGPGFSGYEQVFGAAQSRPRLWVDWQNRVAYYRSWP